MASPFYYASRFGLEIDNEQENAEQENETTTNNKD